MNVEPHNQLAKTNGSSFTVSEAAELLGMPQAMLSRLCDKGRIASIGDGPTRRIDAATVQTILHERDRIKTESSHAIQTAEERRRLRAATAAGAGTISDLCLEHHDKHHDITLHHKFVMYGGDVIDRQTDRAVAALRAVVPANVVWAEGTAGTVRLNGAEVRTVWVGQGTLPDTRSAVELAARHPVFAAHRFTPAAREVLRAARASWVDETGAAEISMGAVVVARDGRSLPPSTPKGWTASTLAAVEAVLVGSGAVTASSVASTSGLSIGAATNALRFLTDQRLLVADSPRGPQSARRVADADRLLAAYADASIPLRKPLVLTVGVLGRDLAAEVVEIGRSWAFERFEWAVTGVLAADLLAPYLTSFGSAVVYVDASTIAELERVALAADLIPTEGGRLTLAPFPTATTRTLATDVDGLRLAPWPRVYADLHTVGVRGEEAAEHLKEVIARGR